MLLARVDLERVVWELRSRRTLSKTIYAYKTESRVVAAGCLSWVRRRKAKRNGVNTRFRTEKALEAEIRDG
jgi:hypothetical protein